MRNRPLENRVAADHGALAAEVPGGRIPVLDVHQPQPGALALHHFQGADVQPWFFASARGGRFADQGCLGTLFKHDQGMAEIGFAVMSQSDQAEQRRLNLDAPGHVKQRTASPERGVQRGEDIIGGFDDVGQQVTLEKIRMALDGLGEVEENRSASLVRIYVTHRRTVDVFNSGGVVRAQVVPEPIKRGTGVAGGLIGAGGRTRRA